MKSIIFAFQALTRINIRQISWNEKEFGRSTIFFPLVGFSLGCVYFIIYYLLKPISSNYIIASILLLLHVMLTGALHLDGLLDTIDSIFSHRSPDRMLEIMKDSHVGSHAVVGAISLLLFRFTLTAEIIKLQQGFILILAPLLARYNQVIVIFGFPYIRPQGLGSFFKRYTKKKEFIIATINTLLLFILSVWTNIIFLFTIFITTLLALYWGKKFTKLFNGLTGDLYGALSELTELVVLVCGYFYLIVARG